MVEFKFYNKVCIILDHKRPSYAYVHFGAGIKIPCLNLDNFNIYYL